MTSITTDRADTPDPKALGAGLRERLAQVAFATDARSATQRNALIAFSVRVASAFILYASQIVMARWMGTFEYGVYVFAWTWVLILGGLSHGGLSIAVIRLLPQYRTRRHKAFERGLLRYGRMLAFATSTAVAALASLMLFAFGDLLLDVYVLPLFLALTCVPMLALSEVQDGIGRANGWMVSGLVPPYILRPLLLLATVVATHCLGFETHAHTAVMAAIFATWLAGAIQFVLIERQLPPRMRSGRSAVDVLGWLRISLPLVTISASEMMLQYADVLVVSAYLTPDQVGIYFASAKTMALIMFVHYAVGSATAQRYATYHANGDKDALASAVRDAVHWTFWPSLACALVILALGRPMLWLFGPEFTSAYGVMFILVVGYLARAAMGPAEFLLNMTGQQAACARVFLTTALLGVAMNLLLVPWFGLYGAAAATATATVITATRNGRIAKRKLGIDVAIWRHLGPPHTSTNR